MASTFPTFSDDLKGWASSILAALAMVISAWVAYAHTQENNSNRLTRIETRQDNVDRRQDASDAQLQYIRDRVDKIYEKVK